MRLNTPFTTVTSFCCIAVVQLIRRSSCFFLPQSTHRFPNLQKGKRSLSLLSMTESDEGWKLSKQREMEAVLEKIDQLESKILLTNNTDDLQLQRRSVFEVETEAKQAFDFIPPPGISMEQYMNEMKLFLELPPSIRIAMARAVDLDDEAARDYKRIPEIVTLLIKRQEILTPKRLSDIWKDVKSTKAKPIDELPVTEPDAEKSSKGPFSFLQRPSQEERGKEIFLPRVTSRRENLPTDKDKETLLQVLKDKSLFIPSDNGAFEVKGGYVIAGKNRKESSQELIESLESRLPPTWNCTFCVFPGPDNAIFGTSDVAELNENGDDATETLLLISDDFSKLTSPWLYRLVSLVGIASAVSFAYDLFNYNESIEFFQSQGFTGRDKIGLLLEKMGEVLLPLFAIVTSHEIGHFVAAKKYNMAVDSIIPTFIPFQGPLPLLSSVTRLMKPPKNFTELYDFALLGPAFGFVTSFLFLGLGLLATPPPAGIVPTNAADVLPALPVSVLTLSTLGGTVVDYFFGGGGGFISAQDVDAPIQMHPFLVAGYCGLLLNAAEMLPAGANDGGRLALSIFGRFGLAVMTGTTWVALFISTFTLDANEGVLLLWVWVANSIFQSDNEIPCRDETQTVDAARSLVAFLFWFLSLLVVIPLT